MSSNQKEPKPQLDAVVVGDDAIGDYLHRLQSGQLTAAEQRAGVSRKPKLGENSHGANVMGKDEYPDENLPND